MEARITKATAKKIIRDFLKFNGFTAQRRWFGAELSSVLRKDGKWARIFYDGRIIEVCIYKECNLIAEETITLN